MKHVIELNLPEDEDELSLYNKARDMFMFISELKDLMRKIRKYDDALYTDEVEKVFEQIYQVMDDNDCSNIE